jgi:inhibitor of cysteine peptidase
MSNIKNILNELYVIDPTLREHEAKLIPAIEEIVYARPDVVIDASFAQQLKNDLLSPNKQDIVEFVPPGLPAWFGKFAGVAIMLAIAIVGISLLRDGQIADVIDDGKTKVYIAALEKFVSEDEYIEYFNGVQQYGDMGFGGGFAVDQMMFAESSDVRESATIAKQALEPSRVSNTNVQVLGIDEPDIVKTNGQELFVSLSSGYYHAGPFIEPMFFDENIITKSTNPSAPYPEDFSTRIIDVTNPEELEIIENIDAQGDLLLEGDDLVVFSGNIIQGFDVSNPNDPNKEWEMELDNSRIITSRLYNGKIYLVTSTYTYGSSPCPVPLLRVDGRSITVPCTDIYRPNVIMADASTYHVFIVNPSDGDIEKQVSFVGSGNSSVVYMSGDNLYVTYTYQQSKADVMIGFLQEAKDIFPNDVRDRIIRLADLDISNQAKSVELDQIINRYTSELDRDEQRRFENELRNEGQQYIEKHIRELQTTSVVQIGLDDLNIDKTGAVPGQPLNQFSLDEYKGNLRIVTTVGEGWFGRLGGSAQSANDVYVLDGDLDMVGSVKDLGLTERVYSARFVGEVAYVVTFRQTDPFYVIDLSNPRRPKMKGELKIPGFSSYLHPLTDDLILGVGEERNQVKLSLFDVSDPTNPSEVDKYSLDAYWSDVANTHHAFLQDTDNEVFFIPAGADAYIFSYENDEIDLRRTVADIGARRALYINDAMFIVGDIAIISLDIDGWDELDRIKSTSNKYPLIYY